MSLVPNNVVSEMGSVEKLSDDQFAALGLAVNREEFSQIEFGQFVEQVMVAIQKLLEADVGFDRQICQLVPVEVMLGEVPCKVAFVVQALRTLKRYRVESRPYVDFSLSIVRISDDNQQYPQEIGGNRVGGYEMLLGTNQLMGGKIQFLKDSCGDGTLTFIDSKARDDWRDKGLEAAFWLSLNLIGMKLKSLVAGHLSASAVRMTMFDGDSDGFGPKKLTTRTAMAGFLGAQKVDDVFIKEI